MGIKLKLTERMAKFQIQKTYKTHTTQKTKSAGELPLDRVIKEVCVCFEKHKAFIYEKVYRDK